MEVVPILLQSTSTTPEPKIIKFSPYFGQLAPLDESPNVEDLLFEKILDVKSPEKIIRKATHNVATKAEPKQEQKIELKAEQKVEQKEQKDANVPKSDNVKDLEDWLDSVI